MSQVHVVIVDDEKGIREFLARLLTEAGYAVTAVADAAAALQVVKETVVQAILIDLWMPGMDGLELLQEISRLDSKIAGIVMTGYGTIEAAVKAMKAGAVDFITKPFDADAALLVIRKALEFQRLRQENLLLRRSVREHYRLQSLVGTSESMQAVLRFIEEVADSDSTVLIQGESGTGKELVARALHFNSMRRDRPFVPVNCAAIPESLLESELFGHEKGAFTGAVGARPGRFEMAHGGTIFLDEVGEMNLSLQVKLLRVLQERCFERVGGTKTIAVDVRIIAATNQDLEQLVQEKRFRQDLYYRLNVIPILLPPLRERQSDIPLLVDHFITRFNRLKRASIQGVEPEAMDYLMRYQWPGNIRELENLIERLVVLKKTGSISKADLPEKILQSLPRPVTTGELLIRFDANGINLMKELELHETRLILEALRQAKGVTSKAAQLLHLNRTTLVEKLKRKGLDPKLQCDLSSDRPHSPNQSNSPASSI